MIKKKLIKKFERELGIKMNPRCSGATNDMIWTFEEALDSYETHILKKVKKAVPGKYNRIDDEGGNVEAGFNLCREEFFNNLDKLNF
jgi:hypothetical protein